MRVLPSLGFAVVGLVVASAVLADAWEPLLWAMPGIVFVALALTHPRLGLLLWLLLAPIANTYASVNLPVGLPDLTFGRVAVGLVGVALLIRLMLKGERLVPAGRVELAMLGLVLVMTVDLMARSGNPLSDALQNFDERITPMLLFLAARNLCVRSADMKYATAILVLIGGYLAAHGMYQWTQAGSIDVTAEVIDLTSEQGGQRVNESHLQGGRAVGPFASAVEYGSVSAIALLGSMFLLIEGRSIAGRIVPAVAVPLTSVAVVLSATRSVWLGASVALLLMAALDHAHRKLIVLGTGIAVLAVAVLLVALPDRTTLFERSTAVEPLTGRLAMYEAGMRIAARQPLVGYGRGAPARIAARQELHAIGGSDAGLAPGQFHNIFLMTLVEWGLPGLLAYVAVIGLIVMTAVDVRRRLPRDAPAYHFAAFFLAATAMYLTQGLVVDTPPFLYLNGVYFFLAGLVHAQLDALRSEDAMVRDPSYGSEITSIPADGAPA